MARQQINVRLSDELVAAIDEKRVALRDSVGGILSRSDVVRLAIEAFVDDGKGDKAGSERGPKGSTQKNG